MTESNQTVILPHQHGHQPAGTGSSGVASSPGAGSDEETTQIIMPSEAFDADPPNQERPEENTSPPHGADASPDDADSPSGRVKPDSAEEDTSSDDASASTGDDSASPAPSPTKPTSTARPRVTTQTRSGRLDPAMIEPDERLTAVLGIAPVGDAGGRDRALAQVAVLVPAIVMAALGLIRAHWPALWADELATWGAATAPWENLWGMLSEIDAIMAPYYVLMWGWVKVFGASDFSLRVPSILAMTAATGLVAALGTRLASPRVGLIAGLLFALFPATSRYAQEARMYAFVVFAGVLATLLLVRALDDRPRLGRWAAYTGGVALLGLFHAVALLLLAAHALTVLLLRRSSTLPWLISAIAGCLPALPLLYIGYFRQRSQVSWIPETSADRLVDYPEQLFGLALIGAVVIALSLLSISLRYPAVVYTTWALIPAGTLYVVSAFMPLWLPRYLLFTLPAWALLAATALGRAPVMRGLVAVMAMVLFAVPTHLTLREPDGHTQATRDLAAILTVSYQEGDVIVYGPNDRGEGRVGRDLVAHYVPDDRTPADVLTTRPLRTDGFYHAEECEDVASCLGEPARVWVLRVGDRNDPLFQLGEAKEDVLREYYEVEQIWHPTGLTLALLVRESTVS